MGYFRTSGFDMLSPAMKDVEKIRVLVGLNIDFSMSNNINKAYDENTLETVSHKKAKECFSNATENEFIKSEDTPETEKGVRLFIDWLKTGKIEMRMYPGSCLHAKVYIMRKDPDIPQEIYGSVITGSSNFSYSGLENNLEFNVELKDSRDVDFALSHFEDLWGKSVDIKDIYIDTIMNKTWLKDDITPYELYLKTLYEFFKEEINEDKGGIIEEMLPEGYMRLQYQIDAVTQAKKKLEAYGGIFISDVVGLGKTYICAMLAKSLKKGKKLIICPPVLVDYWNSVLLEFDVAAKVESLGKLEKLIEQGVDDFEYIFIDEAHRFRNQDTEGFKLLHEICYGKKVVLVSATPINNYSSDIENQIYLFQSKHNSTLTGIKNLEGFFGKLNGALKKKEKGSPEYLTQLRHNSKEIRDKILRDIMIRRTRKEIVEFYKEDLEKQGLSFPKLGTPERVIYTFDKETDNVFKETMSMIASLYYARYTPLLYLNDNKKYATMISAQHNMGGFMKSILVKRLESSFYAFKMTLGRFIESYQQFINMSKSGDIYISKKVNVYDLLDSGDDEKLIRLVDDERVQYFKLDDFNDYFMPSLERDLAILKSLKTMWSKITIDPKLEQFIRELKTNKILQGNKFIIFTESKETAGYLGENLAELYCERVIVFSGESSNQLKRVIENSFNPKFKEKDDDRYDVLITTDVLAEGINLHRANVVINYDLPWNPTKIMQRVGRINRVGTEFDRIYVFNFFPTSQTSLQLPIEDRIMEKLQAFHDTLGEDFKYLSEDEQISSHKLFVELTKDLSEDEVGTNQELAYLAVIRQVRDNDIELFEKIKKLPIKAKTGKYLDSPTTDSTITFIRKGYLKMFFRSDADITEQLTFIDAISYIKSNEEDKAINIDDVYFEHLNNNKNAFVNKLNEEDEIIAEITRVGGNDAIMVKQLKGLSRCKKFTDEQDEKIEKMIELWTNGEIPQSLTKEILREIKIVNDEVQAFYTICDNIPDRYFAGRNEKRNIVKGEKQVVLSCYLRKDEK